MKSTHSLQRLSSCWLALAVPLFGACGSGTVGIVSSSQDGGTTVRTVTEIQVVELDKNPGKIFLTATGPEGQISVRVYYRKDTTSAALPVTLVSNTDPTVLLGQPILLEVSPAGEARELSWDFRNDLEEETISEKVRVFVLAADIPPTRVDELFPNEELDSALAGAQTFVVILDPAANDVPRFPTEAAVVVPGTELPFSAFEPALLSYQVTDTEQDRFSLVVEFATEDPLEGFPADDAAGSDGSSPRGWRRIILVGSQDAPDFAVHNQVPDAPDQDPPTRFDLAWDVPAEDLPPGSRVKLRFSLFETTVVVNAAGVPEVRAGRPGQSLVRGPLQVDPAGDPDAIDASLTSVTVDPAGGVVANGIETATVTVLVRDVDGNPVPGQLVLIDASGTGNTLVQPLGSTGADGRAVGTIASTKAETKSLSAMINPGLSQTILATGMPTLEFVGDPATVAADRSSVTVDRSSGVVANGVDAAAISILVRDVNENPVQGRTVRVTASGAANSIVPDTGITDAGGRLQATLTSTAAELKTILVTVDGTTGSVELGDRPTVALIGDPSTISAQTSSVTAEPAVGLIANGLDASTVTVTVRDGNGNAVAGQLVRILASGSGNLLVQPAELTDDQGRATGSLATTTAETKTISVLVSLGGDEVTLEVRPSVVFGPDPKTISPARSSVVASPTSDLIADGTRFSTITITVRDLNGNAVPGLMAQVASSNPGDALVQPPGPTDAEGRTLAALAATVAETKTITVTVGGSVVLDDRPTVAFVGDPATIDAALSSAVADPTSVVADGSAFATVTITVRDANGNPVPGQTALVSTDDELDRLTQGGLTDGTGTTRATIATTVAGTRTVTVTVLPESGAPVVLAARPVVDFRGDPTRINGTRSSASASPVDGLIADGADLSTLTILVRDVNGNPVAGQAVAIAATGTGNTLSIPAPTDENGQTTATLAALVAETKTLTITVNPGPNEVLLRDMPAVTFVGDPSAVDAAGSTVTVSPAQGVLANGSASAEILVTLRDVRGNLLGGLALAVASSDEGDAVAQPGITDSAGRALAALTSTTAGTKTISVTVQSESGPVPLASMPTVTFVGDPSAIDGALSSATAEASTEVIADGLVVSTITITVRDVNTNPVSGQAVLIASTGASNTILQPATLTDDAGRTTATLATTRAETKAVTVTVNPGPRQVVLASVPTVEFIGNPSTIDAARSTVLADPTVVVADGDSQSTITVTVRDVNDNAVRGQLVELASLSDGGGEADILTQPNGPTDANGQAVGAIASTFAETKPIRATINPGSPGAIELADVLVDFVAGPPSPLASVVTVEPDTDLVANGLTLANILVIVRDAFGNPVVGQSVQLAASGSNNTLVQPAGPTDPAGQVTATLASTTAETKTLVATVDPAGPAPIVLGSTPSVEFVPGPLDAALSSATANPATAVIADGLVTSTITVILRDASGNPLAGRAVRLDSGDSESDTLTQPAPTDAAGQTTGTIASTLAGTKSIVVEVDPPEGTLLVDVPTVEFIGNPATISAALSSATASPETGVIANGVDTSTISVTVRDANGNPVGGQLVEITSLGYGGIGGEGQTDILTQSGPTDENGQASATIAGTFAEVKPILVTVNPGPGRVDLSTLPTVEFVGDPATIDAAFSFVGANPALGVRADGVATSTVSIALRDANFNAVAGQIVQITSSGSNNTLTQPPPTDVFGRTTATLASTTVETKTITVTVNPGGPSPFTLDDTPTVEFVSGISAALSTVVPDPDVVFLFTEDTTSTITVTVLDTSANPVAGQTVQLAATGTFDELVQPAATTDANGVATGTIISFDEAVATITATVNPGPNQVVLTSTPTVTFTFGEILAADSRAFASPDTGLVADGVATSTLTVTLRGRDGKPVPGRTLRIDASGSNNVLTKPPPTDASGRTTATLASTTAETKTLTLTVLTGRGEIVLGDRPTVTFVGDPATIDAALSLAAVGPERRFLADGLDAASVHVVVRDAHGNPVAGQTVEFAATGSDNVLTQPVAVTDASGRAHGSLATTAAETKLLTVTVNPGSSAIALTATPQAEFVGALGRVYHVRPGGSDDNAGTSPAEAWRTLGRAALALAAGDTVRVGAGTYVESVRLTAAGTAASPILFRADAGEVVVDAGGAAQAFHLDGARHLVLEGFTITGAAPGQESGGAILVEGAASSHVTLRGNEIHGNTRGLDVRASSALTIESNRISNNGGEGGEGIRVHASADCTIRNNLVYNNSGSGIVLASGAAARIESNTLHANGSHQIHATGAGTSAMLRDNIITDGARDGLAIEADASGTSLHNLVFGNRGSDWNGLAMGVGDLSADPLFIDPDGPDGLLGGAESGDDRFQLDPGAPSPALETGSGAAAALVLSDGKTLAERTSRIDGVLDGSAPDGARVNLGYHYPPATSPPRVAREASRPGSIIERGPRRP